MTADIHEEERKTRSPWLLVRLRSLGWDPFAIFRYTNVLEEMHQGGDEITPKYRVKRLFRDTVNIRVTNLDQLNEHSSGTGNGNGNNH